MEKNKKRFFVEAVDLAAKEQGIEAVWLSDEWVCELKKGSQKLFLYGFNFPLNTATGWEVAKDKAATYQILTKYRIDCVEHRLFIRPELKQYNLENTNAKGIFDYADQLGYPLVCKDNCGAGGNNVFKVFSKEELQDALSSVWKISRGASLCPFYEIECEYRFFILDGEIQFIFKKLLSGHEWKFNLSKGGEVELVEVGSILENIQQEAIKTAECLGLKICSVDIIKLKNSEKYMVLEVNTAITTEYFSKKSPEAKKLSEKLYFNILKKMFE